jgi:hypothetical protein
MDNERCPADSLLILYIDICDSLGRDSATSSCPSRDTKSSYDWNVPQIKQYVCLLVICEMQNLMFLAELPRIVSAEQAARPIQPLLEELAYLLESEARNQQRNINSALRSQQHGPNKVGMSWTDAMVVPWILWSSTPVESPPHRHGSTTITYSASTKLSHVPYILTRRR